MTDSKALATRPRRQMSRRSALATAASLLAVFASSAPLAAPKPTSEWVYIGTQASEPGRGVFAARLDTRTGKLTPQGLAAEAQRPTWLSAHPTLPVLYAVNEVGNDGKSHGWVQTYRADPATGALTLAGTVESGGGGPTYLSLDLPSRTMLVANFGTGQIAALPVLADATLGPPASVQNNQGSGPSPRQKGPHAHSASLDPSRRFALVADMGADRIFIYRYDQASHQLGSSTTEALPPGTGPRHLAFHPNGRFLFMLSELTAELRGYSWNARQGELRPIQTVVTSADPAKGVARGAEIVVSRDGRFVYASIRGEDALLVYAVDRRTGALSRVQRLAAGGQAPWSFGIDPSGSWMLVANQISNTVTVFARDPATGRLAPTPESMPVIKPVSIAYLAGGAPP